MPRLAGALKASCGLPDHRNPPSPLLHSFLLSLSSPTVSGWFSFDRVATLSFAVTMASTVLNALPWSRSPATRSSHTLSDRLSGAAASPYVQYTLIAILALGCLLRASKNCEFLAFIQVLSGRRVDSSDLASLVVRTIFVFAWNCFVQPIGKVANQSERLDKFYQHQASSECRNAGMVAVVTKF